jgi:LPXTG-motif cell wall-anchored protein
MRKLTVLLGVLVLNVFAAVPALADSVVVPPEQPPGGIVVVPPGAGSEGPGGLAFTGGQVTVWMVLSLALLVLGIGLIVAGRRRRAAAE